MKIDIHPDLVKLTSDIIDNPEYDQQFIIDVLPADVRHAYLVHRGRILGEDGRVMEWGYTSRSGDATPHQMAEFGSAYKRWKRMFSGELDMNFKAFLDWWEWYR